MQIIGYLFNWCLSIYNIQFQLFGYTMSLYALLLFSVIAGFVMWFFYKFFS